MTANFHYDICAAILMLVLLIGIVVRKLYRGRTNMVFLLLVITGFLPAVTDFLSEAAKIDLIISRDNIVLRSLVDYLFFVSRNLTAPVYILYIASLMGVWYMTRSKRYLIWFWTVPYIIDLVIILGNVFTGWLFRYEGNEYHRGPMLYVLYVVAFYYIVISLVVVLRFRRLTTVDKVVMLIVFLPVNSASVLLQVINPQWRYDIITTAILIVVTAVSIQRPEEFIDYVTNSQSNNSFRNEMRMAFAASTPIVIYVYKFINQRNLRVSVGLENNSQMLRKIADEFGEINDKHRTRASVFYLDNGVYAAVSADTYCERMISMGKDFLKFAEKPIKINKMEFKLESRACLIRFPKDMDSVESLLGFIDDFENRIPDTDELVYIEKLAMTKDFRMRNDMNAIISRSIQNDKFQMYYQPIYSIKEKKFYTAESLIRLFDDDYGFISPAIFIPAAEKTGAIHQIGDYVFNDVCRLMSSEEFRALGMSYIEINLSVAQCIEYDLVERVKRAIGKYYIRPDQINLEITETAVDYDPTVTDRNINMLSEMGFTFSLDDYGTGYSNINRVVSLPIDIVKIDKSLVDEVDNPQMWIVITNTIKMLKNMNKKILVEGVEDEHTANKFIELDCDYIQGYYYSKPLPEKEFMEFIRKANAEG